VLGEVLRVVVLLRFARSPEVLGVRGVAGLSTLILITSTRTPGSISLGSWLAL